MRHDLLLIHLGGLGDVVLSESVFHSLLLHFGERMAALGNRRFLALFPDYFHTFHSIDSPRWLFLFDDRPGEGPWRQIVFVGKDRDCRLRERWRRLSRQPLLFIDMYPASAFDRVRTFERAPGLTPRETAPSLHVEGYQLAQLPAYGVVPARKVPPSLPPNRVILYPEEGPSKAKWHVECFLSLHSTLRSAGIPALFLEGPGLSVPSNEKVSIEDLKEVRAFFSGGGLFVSNDSGMAHLAGACGLPTLTLFADFDPAFWHPRGANISLIRQEGGPSVPEVERIILNILAGRDGSPA